MEIDDPNVEVAVKLEGVVIHEKSKKRDYTLKPGDGEVLIFDKETGLEVATKRFSLKQGGREIVSARMGELVARPGERKRDRSGFLPGKAPSLEFSPIPTLSVRPLPRTVSARRQLWRWHGSTLGCGNAKTLCGRAGSIQKASGPGCLAGWLIRSPRTGQHETRRLPIILDIKKGAKLRAN
ncbi:MAG: hypothetical protein U0793_29190 [Gemmataceae bacterium]